jgi:hypothetical protein
MLISALIAIGLCALVGYGIRKGKGWAVWTAYSLAILYVALTVLGMVELLSLGASGQSIARMLVVPIIGAFLFIRTVHDERRKLEQDAGTAAQV